MTRTFRIFTVVYGFSMSFLTIGMKFWGHSSDFQSLPDLFFWLGSASGAYLILALACLFTSRTQQEPSLPWIAAFGALMLSELAAFAFSVGWNREDDRLFFLTGSASLLCFFGVASWLYLGMRKGTGFQFSGKSQWIGPCVLLAGGASVLSSLMLRTTSSSPGWSEASASGLDVLLNKTQWITSYANVWADSSLSDKAPWIHLIYASAGYSFYLVAITSTLAMVLWVILARASLRRLQSSRLLPAFTALSTLSTFWVCTDIFWGWHFSLEDTPWAALLATAFWLAAPLFALFLLAPVAWRKGRDSAPLRVFIAFQAPVAAFNFMMLPNYFPTLHCGVDLGIPGLGMLIIGLQLESLMCIALMMSNQGVCAGRVDECQKSQHS
jgi:hypothetical protein